MKDKHPIDDLFREGLTSRKIIPKSEAWEAIQENLNQNKTSSKRTYFLIAVAASVCLLCAATWTYVNTERTKTSQSASLQMASIKKKTSLFVVDKTPELRINLPASRLMHQQGLYGQSIPKALGTTEPAAYLITRNHQVVIHSIEKTLSSMPVESQIARTPYFNLSSHIRNPETLLQPRGIRFNLIKGVVSMAKGVNDGKKAISEMRKSKIEFINEDLKYGSEKESESEATIDQDSPSNEK